MLTEERIKEIEEHVGCDCYELSPDIASADVSDLLNEIRRLQDEVGDYKEEAQETQAVVERIDQSIEQIKRALEEFGG